MVPTLRVYMFGPRALVKHNRPVVGAYCDFLQADMWAAYVGFEFLDRSGVRFEANDASFGHVKDKFRRCLSAVSAHF